MPVISDEVPATQPKTKALKWTVSVIAVAMSLYHMYVAGFGPPEAMIFRGTHLLFALTLVFLLYPLKPGGGARWRMLDMALLIGSWAFILHIFLNYEYVTNRIIYIDDLTTFDKIYAVIAVLIVLEATRRVLGWALPITAFVFLAYAAFLTNVKLPVLMEQLYLSTEGIFGSTLGVSASYVMLFVLFGAFMERSGTGKLFMDFALAITGHTAGGPGKVSVISSSLFGTVSGSAVANVMVDGPMTIPLMKKTGFHPPFAAAVEAVASTGGQIMPPVMGAAAFVMAEFLAVSYFQVTLWAAIPAILYYVAVFFAVHFKAKRVGLLGVPKSELPRLGAVMRERGHLFVPIVIVFIGADRGLQRTAVRAGRHALLPADGPHAGRSRARTSAGSRCSKRSRTARGTRCLVAMACACAGIVIGCVTLTGMGISFTQFVVGAGAEHAAPCADAHRDRRHRPRHGHADHPGLHRHGLAARSGAGEARRDRPGRAYVRVLFRHPLGDHAAGGARRFCRGQPCQNRPLESGLGSGAHRRRRLHRAVHVHVRAVAADDRRLAEHRLLVHHRHHRHHSSRRFAAGLPDPIGHDVAAGDPVRRGALPDQAGLDHRPHRPRPAGGRVCLAIFCQDERVR